MDPPSEIVEAFSLSCFDNPDYAILGVILWHISGCHSNIRFSGSNH
jgi:hypothetical protein